MPLTIYHLSSTYFFIFLIFIISFDCCMMLDNYFPIFLSFLSNGNKAKLWNYLEIKLANVLKTLNLLGLQQSIQQKSLFLLLFFELTVFFHSCLPERMLLLISKGPPIHPALCFYVPELTTDFFMTLLWQGKEDV